MRAEFSFVSAWIEKGCPITINVDREMATEIVGILESAIETAAKRNNYDAMKHLLNSRSDVVDGIEEYDEKLKIAKEEEERRNAEAEENEDGENGE